jgi:hypothetical protein
MLFSFAAKTNWGFKVNMMIYVKDIYLKTTYNKNYNSNPLWRKKDRNMYSLVNVSTYLVSRMDLNDAHKDMT